MLSPFMAVCVYRDVVPGQGMLSICTRAVTQRPTSQHHDSAAHVREAAEQSIGQEIDYMLHLLSAGTIYVHLLL